MSQRHCGLGLSAPEAAGLEAHFHHYLETDIGVVLHHRLSDAVILL